MDNLGLFYLKFDCLVFYYLEENLKQFDNSMRRFK